MLCGTVPHNTQNLTIGRSDSAQSVVGRLPFNIKNQIMNGVEVSQWNGNVLISRRRIVFVGEAGNTEKQTIHAIKICVALTDDFELSVGSENKGNRYSAVIINAGITHAVKCDGSKIFLLYLLPETQEAREIRWEYLNNDKDNRKAGVYDIPKELIEESLPFLPQILKAYSKWDCKKVFQECDNVIQGLGKIRRRQISTSSDLAEKINGSVKKVIDYIYTEIETQILNQEFDLNRFKTSVIFKEINLPLNKAGWLENEFIEETGTTIGHFFRDIQMLAALKLYAITEALRTEKEKELLKRLENPILTEEERKKIGKLLEEIPKGTYLKTIAKSLGFGTLTKFDKRIKSRLGINLSDLKGQSNFFSCEE